MKQEQRSNCLPNDTGLTVELCEADDIFQGLKPRSICGGSACLDIKHPMDFCAAFHSIPILPGTLLLHIWSLGPMCTEKWHGSVNYV